MAQEYDFSSLGIMVVDDNAHALAILRTLLKAMRVCEVKCFTEPAEALQALGDWLPDVIMADYQMEPLNGLELARHIRAAPGPCRYAPILLVTGHANAKLVAAARDHGIDYSLSKPISLQALYRTFARLRDESRQFVQASRYFGPDRRRKAREFTGPDRRAAS